MRKKRTVGRICLCMLVALVTFAGFGTVAAEPQPKLSVWVYKTYVPELNQHFVDVFREFGAKQGVNVEVTLVGMLDMMPKLTPTIEAGNPPDVITIYGQEAMRFKDNLLDVTDLYIDIGKSLGGWVPMTKNLLVDGKAYGIPYGIELELLYCRSDRLRAAGLSFPTTWEELREAAIKTNDPKHGIYGFGQPIGGRTYDGEKAFRMLLWSYGGRIVAEDGKTVVFDSPETRKAVQFYTDLYLKDKVMPPGATAWTGSDNNIFYVTGRCNFTINTGSIWALIQRTDPLLEEITMIIPSPTGPYGGRTFSVMDVLVIFQGTKHPQLAREMVQYFYDKERFSKAMELSATQHVPPFMDVLKEPLWRGYPGRVFVENALTGANHGYPGPVTVASGEIYTELVISDMLGKVVTGKQSIDEAIKWATERFKETYATHYPEVYK